MIDPSTNSPPLAGHTAGHVNITVQDANFAVPRGSDEGSKHAKE